MCDQDLNQYALNRVASIMPREYDQNTMPSLRQCVGTNRLWGAPLGKALHDDLKSSVESIFLVDIAILSRSILVLDDCLDDEYLDKKHIAIINEFINDLESNLFEIFDKIGESHATHNDLRELSRQEIIRRNNTAYTYDIFRSSINKCLIFFNPYRLFVSNSIRNFEERIHFLEIFFFACQLLDDYQDLKEDKEKKINHNIHYKDRNTNERSIIEQEQLYWAPSLLHQIKLNLIRSDVIIGSSGSQILSYFHNAAILFIDLMISKCDGYSTATQEEIIKFEKWVFNPIDKIQNAKMKSSYNCYIRPEFMQTYMNGFRDISLV